MLIKKKGSEVLVRRKPEWLCRAPGSAAETQEIKRILRSGGLHTVCEEARCPNICECFKRKTATFLILGDICTRNCSFCSVKTGVPDLMPEKFESEALSVKNVVASLGLKHVVVTSVTRDDLSDGGASGFVAVIKALRQLESVKTVEVLIPDFAGLSAALDLIIEAQPDVINHNLETVERLYPIIRPQANYERSLRVLEYLKKNGNGILTKTGIMLGLGEKIAEVELLMQDAKRAGVDIFTAGQYLQPSRSAIEVVDYIQPGEFEALRRLADQVGFSKYSIAPLMRSSYNPEANVI